MTSQWDTLRFGSGVASSWGGPSGQVQSTRCRGWQCQRCKAWCKAKAKCCHQCGLRWAVPGHGQSTTQGNPVTSALEGVATKLEEALGDHAGSQVSSGEMSTEAGATSCGTEGSLSTREKKEAADELASLEAALSALGATRATTQIAQELREQIASKKKTLAATKPIGARVDGCRTCKTRRDQALEAFRLASAALEKANEEVAQSARELAVLEEELVRVQYGPAAETPAAVATEQARCMNKTLGDMKKFHNIPQNHVNDLETLMKTLVEGVTRLATSFSQKAGDEMELEESKAKRLRMVQKQPIQPHLDQEEENPSTRRHRRHRRC